MSTEIVLSISDKSFHGNRRVLTIDGDFELFRYFVDAFQKPSELMCIQEIETKKEFSEQQSPGERCIS